MKLVHILQKDGELREIEVSNGILIALRSGEKLIVASSPEQAEIKSEKQGEVTIKLEGVGEFVVESSDYPAEMLALGLDVFQDIKQPFIVFEESPTALSDTMSREALGIHKADVSDTGFLERNTKDDFGMSELLRMASFSAESNSRFTSPKFIFEPEEEALNFELTASSTGLNNPAVITGDVSGSVTEDAASILITTGKLSVSDPDAGQSFYLAGSKAGTYGTLSIDAAGNWTYTADNSQTAIQSLGAGQTLTDTITVRSADGTEQIITVTITGVNDVAVISGTVSGSVIEDASSILTSTGKLSVSDPDAGQSYFLAETLAGAYGTLSIDASGNWTYTADNSQTAIQQLNAVQSLTETFTVRSADGTEQQITVTIRGVDDNGNAVITGDVSGSVTEDAASILITTGKLSVTDPDAGQSFFLAGSKAGAYGTLNIDAAGNWTFTADNSQEIIQSLGKDDHPTETFLVRSADGSTQEITITINGVDESDATFGGDTTGSVTEDFQVVDGQLTATGVLTVQDVAAEAHFQAESITGKYGTLSIDTDGNWTFTADNSQEIIQSLGKDDHPTETFVVRSADGSTQEITITINGVDESDATFGGDTTGSVTEDFQVVDGQLTATGVLTVQDVAAEAHFQAESITGKYGTLSIDTDGNWTFTADNSQEIIQSLGKDDHPTETFVVRSADGSTQGITITINGVNDDAAISGTFTGSVTEDTDVSSGLIIATGILSVSDPDADQSFFQTETLAGVYGTLSIDAAGNWTLTADNSQEIIQSLGKDDHPTETFVVRSADGSTQEITITINGVNDDAAISGTFTGSVTEDTGVSSGLIIATGILSVSDPDADQSFFQTETLAGVYGTLSIDTDGNWTFTADNSQEIIQSLGKDDHPTETFLVRSADGSTQEITVTINGVNDAPVISLNVELLVDNDATESLTGSLQATDVDNSASELRYFITNAPLHGILLVDSVEITDFSKTVFTQADLDSGRVTFRFDPHAQDATLVLENDSFVFTVTDGVSTTGPATFRIHNTTVQVWGTDNDDNLKEVTDFDRDGAKFHVYGFDGDDTLRSGIGADTLDGGEGIDSADYSSSVAGVNVSLRRLEAQVGGGAGNHAQGDVLSRIENVTGSNYNDTIVGDSWDNALYGLIGHDSLVGGLGHDCLDAGDGHDSLGGSAGNDTLHGGAGNDNLSSGDDDDVLYGEDGDDFLDGGYGADTLDGRIGNDSLYGLFGADSLYGGDGGDLLYGGTDNDTLDGGAGNDTLYGGNDSGRDLLRGGEGNDTLNGDGGNDSLYGGVGNDILNGGADDDVLYGEDGDDVLDGGYGADTLDGRIGNDSLYGLFGADSLYGGDGGDLLYGGTDDDTLDGGAGNDTLYGGNDSGNDSGSDSGSDLLQGGEGDDTLNDDGGNDSLYGGVGDDILNGGADNDVLYGEDGDDFLDGGYGADTLDGRIGNDSLYGLFGDDSLYGGDGGDLLYGGTDNDTLDGGAGNDTLYGGNDSGHDLLRGGEGNDTLNGDDGNDSLYGGVDDDVLYGEDGNDFLDGDAGADTLDGGIGNDTLAGDAGSDSLIGGDGYDVADYGGSDSAVDVNLTRASQRGGHAEGDRLEGIENIRGSSHNDTLTGNSGWNEIDGGDGDDLIDGGYNSDFFIMDWLFGGNGNDTLKPGGDLDGATILNGGDGIDTADFSNFGVGLVVDLIYVAQSSGTTIEIDTLVGIENLIGTSYSDSLIGDSLDNKIEGMGSNDTIIGGTGNDSLYGGAGSDSLYGGDGDDSLVGGMTDTVDGGAGFDTFRLEDNVGTGGLLDLSALTAAGSVRNVEAVDISGDVNDANTLTCKVSDVLDMTGGVDIIWVRGDANDTVTTTDSGWELIGVETGADGQQYNHYSGYAGSTMVHLMIDEGLGSQYVVHA